MCVVINYYLLFVVIYWFEFLEFGLGWFKFIMEVIIKLVVIRLWNKWEKND